ncbi:MULTISPECIES: hypothetical protein [unclassified Halomonas]|uniref:hypothetical protein n=1 Tax=unclassified Halomonas TaxID=2609666 RepID=UPI001EF53574|nr:MULTISPECIES: hypothetical protein [unclassified Halomonas]MCG7605725.1 hypothetical protein [Halomonas sp. MM17-34]MCG7621726.1 hypothetical protein [Halomonas sp. DSH1-27]
MITLNTGQKQWHALIEAKVGNDAVGEEQLLKYIKQAKEHGVNAVITITNQFVALPTHHPVPINKKHLRSVEIFHWSWTYIVTMAQLLLAQDKIESQDQRFILHEVVKYLEDPSSGKVGFTSMNPEWKTVVQSAFNNTKLNKNSEEVINTVSSWHQEQRELCLQMWPLVGEKVDIKLPRAHKNDPKQRLADDCEKLANDHNLTSTIAIPNAASDLYVTINLSKKSITCSMRLEAPKDKKSSSAKINWLTRQLPQNEKNPPIRIKAIRKGQAMDTDKPLEEVRQYPTILDADNTDSQPVSFEVFTSYDLGTKFSGNRVFIEQLEKIVPDFYRYAGQHLKAWVAPAPRVKQVEQDPEEETEAQLTTPSDE